MPGAHRHWPNPILACISHAAMLIAAGACSQCCPVTTVLPCRRVVERGHYAITIEEGVPALGQEMQGLKQMLADFERDLGALQVHRF